VPSEQVFGCYPRVEFEPANDAPGAAT